MERDCDNGSIHSVRSYIITGAPELSLLNSPTSRSRAQKSWEDGEKCSWTEPNLMDSLVPKQRIKQIDRQKDRDTDSQTDRQPDTDSQKIDRKAHGQTFR